MEKCPQEVLSGLCAVLSHSVMSDSWRPPVVRQAPLSIGILQARMLEWVAMPSSRGSSQPRGQTGISYISCIERRVLCHQRHPGTSCGVPTTCQAVIHFRPLLVNKTDTTVAFMEIA